MQTEGKLSFCFLKAHTQNDAFLLLVMALLDSVMWLCIILSLYLLLYHSNVILLFLTASVGLVLEKKLHWWICSLCVLQSQHHPTLV